MKVFLQEKIPEIKTLPAMTDLAYCGYFYICTRRASGEQYGFLFLLAIMVLRIYQLSTRSIRSCCIFRALETALKASLTLWGLFCYRFFLESAINRFPLFPKVIIYFVYQIYLKKIIFILFFNILIPDLMKKYIIK